MATALRAATAGALIASLALAACSEPTSVVFDITLGEPRSTTQYLKVQVKRYIDDARVEYYDADPIALEPGATELSLLVELPAEGRYAVHFVASGGVGPRLVDTRCFEAAGEVVDGDVVLEPLDQVYDLDGDTFPDTYVGYCEWRTLNGRSCDSACDDPAYLALVDCGPPEGFELSARCPGPIPPNAEWNPFALDSCSDCFDQDCYGGDLECEDVDGDGFSFDRDCDDSNPAINPAAAEGCGFEASADCPGCGDAVDNDCDGVVDDGCFDDDLDGDGVAVGDDCNDCDPGIGPRRVEVCGNGVDDDCSGDDQPCDPLDEDADGHATVPSGDDCLDRDPRTHPGAPDRCGDAVAQDCASDRACTDDADGDGFAPGDDCAPHDPAINPWATELCDPHGVDEDCDGVVNESARPGEQGCVLDSLSGRWRAVDFGSDMDHCGSCRHRCERSSWREGDSCIGGECLCGAAAGCDGARGLRSWCCPGAGCVDLTSDVENCGACGVECGPGEVCEPSTPDGPGRCTCPSERDAAPCPDSPCWMCCPDRGCVDACIDETVCRLCEGGRCTCSIDCEDGDPCTEGTCTAGLCRQATIDADDDGFCAPGCLDAATGELGECEDSPADCDDSDPQVSPAATERCATVADDDCDGETNDPDAEGCVNYFMDEDGDGHGRGSWVCLCGPSAPYLALVGDDCDDSNPATYPGALELCDMIDEDCDGLQDSEDEISECPCCGWPLECRECCGDDDCPEHSGCHDNECRCDSGWQSCAGTCDCNTGGGEVCCGGACIAGDCCDAAGCPSSHDSCVDHRCTCDAGYESCGGACNCNTGGGEVCCDGNCRSGDCCGEADCPGPHDTCHGNRCTCEADWSSCAGSCDCNTGAGAICCDGACYVGTCCSDDDCTPPTTCSLGHRCV